MLLYKNILYCNSLIQLSRVNPLDVTASYDETPLLNIYQTHCIDNPLFLCTNYTK